MVAPRVVYNIVTRPIISVHQRDRSEEFVWLRCRLDRHNEKITLRRGVPTNSLLTIEIFTVEISAAVEGCN